MKTTTTTYGTHLTLRVAEIENRIALEGAGRVTNLLTTIVDRIGMRVLAGPLVGEETGIPEKRGWSGVVILYESHTAIHTYPEFGEAFIDIFSCCEYSIDTVKETLREFFGSFTVVEQNVFDRGVHWGVNVHAEMDSWLVKR